MQKLAELKKPIEAQLKAQKEAEQEQRRVQMQERRYFESQRRAAAILQAQTGPSSQANFARPSSNSLPPQ